MLKVKSGEVEKLGVLYHRYKRRLFGFFHRMTFDVAASEDLVQNVFMRILKYKHSYQDQGNFESWIFQLARNVHKDYLKKNNRYRFQEDMTLWESELKEAHDGEKEMQQKEEEQYLALALRALSAEKRELIEMTRFQQMKYSQVASILGITESAVKVRMHRILKELKENYLKLDT